MLKIKQFDMNSVQDSQRSPIVGDPLHPDNSRNLTPQEIQKHTSGNLRGFGVITDKDGNQLSEPNLVVLGGREFAAHKLADKTGPVNFPSHVEVANLLDFKIRYFGVGRGAQEECNTDNLGAVYSNDIELYNPIKIGEGNVGSEMNYKYIHDGYLKRIESDGGSIEILEEDHQISAGGTSFITLQANTSIKFSMKILEGELSNYPERFNEAALYSVEMNGEIPKGLTDNERFNASKRLFAKFTTLNKYLAAGDGISLDWYILT